MGKILIILGVVLIGLGLVIPYINRIPFLGKLPGDIIVEKNNFRIYFPIATSILLSVLLSVILYFINKFKN
jgi:hypothetical protein